MVDEVEEGVVLRQGVADLEVGFWGQVFFALDARDHFIGRVRDRLRTETGIAAHKDYIHQPTYAEDLVEAALHLIRTGQTGTFHAANSGSTDEFGVAKKLVQLLGRTDVEVQADLRGRAAMRPKNALLNTRKLGATGHRMRSWEEALGVFVMSLEAAEKK